MLRHPLLILLAFSWLVAGIGIFLAGRIELRDAVEEAKVDLSAILLARSRQLAAWRAEILDDAAQISANRLIQDEILEWGDAGDARLAEDIASCLEGYVAVGEYANATLAGPDGVILLSAGADGTAPREDDGDDIRAAARSTGPTVSHIHADMAGRAHIHAFSPIVDVDGRTIAVFVLTAAMDEGLAPILRPRASPHGMVEVLLLTGTEGLLRGIRDGDASRTEFEPAPGDEVIRFLRHAVALSEPRETTDGDGIAVVAGAAPVEGTDWTAAARLPMESIVASVRPKVAAMGGLAFLALLAISAAVAGAWLVERRNELRRTLADARRHGALLERFEYLLMEANDIILVVDDGGLIVEANERAAEEYGMSRTELLRTSLAEIAVPAHAEVAKARIDGLAAGEGARYDSRHRRAGGAEFPVEVSVRRIDIGGVRQFQLIVRNTEARDRAADALRERERLLGNLSRAVPGFVFQFEMRPDGSARLPYASEGIRDTFELVPEQVRESADAIFAAIHPEDIDRFRRSILHSAESLDEWRSEFRVVLPRQGLRWREAHSSAERLPDGTVRWHGYAQDITDRKRVEAALENERIKLRELLRCIPNMVFMKDLDGCFVACNAAFEEYMGRPESELIGRTDYDFVEESLAEFFRENDRQAIAAGKPRTNEELLTYPDGRQVLVEMTKNPVRDAAGNPVGILGISRDITESRRLEEEFRQAQKLETVGRLAGGVAHDFNNMLAVVLGSVERARMRMCVGTMPTADLGEIENAARRAAELVRQLLAFSRRQPASPRIVDVAAEVARSRVMLESILGEEIELRHRFESEPWSVRIDPSQIDQILMNLVVNARDAMRGIGSVDIDVENVVVGPEHPGAAPGEYVRLSVADTGCGMDAETMNRIFEPFFTTKEQGKGTGLGLSTVYGIATQNGGFVRAESEPGSGSVLSVWLPRCAAEEPEKREGAPTAEPAWRESASILLVEDERTLRELLVDVLRKRGFAVAAADGPRDAIRLCEAFERPFDLLLTDVVMPEMNGKDLHDAVRRLRPGIRTLFMSGFASDVLGREDIGKGVGFIQKPFSPSNELVPKIREVLAGA